MSELYCMITIVRRELSEEYIGFYKEKNISFVLNMLCNGTARQKTLDYLGLEKTEKMLLMSVISGENVKTVNRELVRRMQIDLPGNGIAVSIPISSMGGSAMKYLAQGQTAETKEGKDMNDMQYSLIMIIAESGGTDAVMDAARAAGAGGGTVIHAKGTANGEHARNFFGVSIASGKELILIVSRKEEKDAIMKSVMEKAGAKTETRALVFSLPVNSVVGLRSVTEEQ